MPLNPIIEALKKEDFRAAERLADNISLINTFDDGPEEMGVDESDKESATRTGRTPLIVASEVGASDCVVKLLRLGAKVDLKEKTTIPPRKRTALSYAAERGHLEIVKALLDHGAKPDTKDDNIRDEIRGKTPLHYAAEAGCLDIVKLLIAHGGDLNATTKCGYTPIILAISNDRFETVEFLLEALADLTLATENGCDALGSAIDRATPNLDLIARLLKNGACVNGHNSVHNPPLCASVMTRNQELVETLLNAGADINLQQSRGFTALMYSVLCSDWTICELLLQRGADPSPKNINLQTASHIANKRGEGDLFQAVVNKVQNCD